MLMRMYLRYAEQAGYKAVISNLQEGDEENVLSSVKDFCKGRVIGVFGCGGDRDPMKRPIMGEIGVRLSDLAVITSDNPRTEEPEEHSFAGMQ